MRRIDTEFLARAPQQSPPSQAPAVDGKRFPKDLIGWVVLLSALAWLWYRLIDDLRGEWASNPQYGYGFVVPILCIGLICRRWGSLRETYAAEAGAGTAFSGMGGKVILGALALLALMYLPTRVIEEAIPEWRPVKWSLGLETVGLTLGAVYLACGKGCLKRCLFPICFILIAIPWPTIIEAPVIQLLTRLNSGVVSEGLLWVGVPALQHGNLIEVITGTVGVEEACSGIRSFQTSLMISLFFGEFYEMASVRRWLLIAAGFFLAMVFNAGRVFSNYAGRQKGCDRHRPLSRSSRRYDCVRVCG